MLNLIQNHHPIYPLISHNVCTNWYPCSKEYVMFLGADSDFIQSFETSNQIWYFLQGPLTYSLLCLGFHNIQTSAICSPFLQSLSKSPGKFLNLKFLASCMFNHLFIHSFILPIFNGCPV